MSVTDAAAPSTRQRTAVVGLALAILVASLGTSIVNVALPTMAADLGAPVAQTQWVVLGYLLPMTIASVTVGRIGDALGRQRVLVGGLVLFMVATAACALAPSLTMLVIARAVQGVGAAAMITLPLALVRESLPRNRTGSAMGLLATSSAVGTALGPAGGGGLVEAFGWPAVFVAMLPVTAAATLLMARRGPRIISTKPSTRVDAGGVIVFSLALLAFTLAATFFASIPIWTTGALLLSAVGLGVAFVAIERRAGAPLVAIELLRQRELNVGLARNAVVAVVMMSTLVVGPFYLSLALELDPAAVGLTMTVGPVISVITGVLAGRLVDRVGAAPVAMLGLAAMVSGATLMAVLPPLLSVGGYLGAIVVLTPGYQLFLAANNAQALTVSPAAQAGAVAGLLSLSRSLGLIAGASLMGGLFSAAADAFGGTPQTSATAGMQTTFAVGALLLALAAAYGIPRHVARSRRRSGAGDTSTTAQKGTTLIAASLNGTLLAEAAEADIIHIEGDAYFPPATVKHEHLEKSPTQYTCSVKGEMQYFSVKDPATGELLHDWAWSYPAPNSSSVAEVGVDYSGYVAFAKGVQVG